MAFQDRIPTQANRRKLTIEDTGEVHYATIEYADEPIQEGTPVNSQLANASFIAEYEHTYNTDTHIHNFQGSGSNGKALLTAVYKSGDTFAVNGVATPCYTGDNTTEELFNGKWIYFVYDGTQMNIIAGGGGGSVGTRLVHNYTAVGGEKAVSIIGGDITELKTNDILYVYIENLPMFEGLNYTIDSSTNKINVATALTAGQPVRFEVIRAVSAEGLTNTLDLLNEHKADNTVHLVNGVAPNSTKLNGHTDTYFAKATESLSMKLLWTNASPTSNFVEQTIQADLTGMIGVYISFYGNNSGGISGNANGGAATIFPGSNSFRSSNAGIIYSRTFKKTDNNHIFFEHAYNTANWTITDNWCIPYQIYGIKGVME